MSNRLAKCSVAPFVFIGLGVLAACGGGGAGGGSIAPGGGVSAVPTPTPTGAPLMTTASGVLVDDPSGAPLAGISVKIKPWVGAATPLPAPQTITDANGNFTLANVPNGHYLLVIGSDSTGDTTRPTIHDNVTLTGGNQTLHAPVLPPIPTVTPPAMETNGSYRLMSIDQTREKPCFDDFNNLRTSNSLAKVVQDEWLTENARYYNQYHASSAFVPGQSWPGNPFGALSTGGLSISGGNSCANTVPQISDNYANSLETVWFAGTWYLANPSNVGSGFGITEIRRDPRSFTDPNISVWP